MSISPSPSISAANTDHEGAVPAITALVQVGFALPSFSYQAMVLSLKLADTMSISPSPSISAANTDRALRALVSILAAAQVGFALPSFSYQAMVLSNIEADKMSISPSPSISAANTDHAPSAFVSITALVQVGFALPSFSYQAMVSSCAEADTISISPSPSISAAKTEVAETADVVISSAVQVGFALPSFSYQAMVLSFEEADKMSISPSPSISAANTDNGKSALVAISAAVKVTLPEDPPPMTTFERSPPEIEMVGVVVRASEKVAVMVTVFDAAIRLSESEFVNVTDGAVESSLIVILSDPA